MIPALLLVAFLAACLALLGGVAWGRRLAATTAETSAADAERAAEVAAVTAAASEAATLEVFREEMRRTAEEQRRVLENQRDATLKAALDQMLASQQAVGEQQQKRAEAALTGKQTLIDAQLRQMHEAMQAEMHKVEELMTGLEKDRVSKFGQLAQQLQSQNETLTALTGTTQGLREALASQKVRGQWGERMAEDVLRMAGFVENINYRKQKALLGDATGIPDFTFLLPQDLIVHMDVKFPLDNYVRYLEANSELDQKRHRDQFLRDVRQKVKDVAARDYIDASGGTVDCVLLFIPNESLYAFIHEQDREILEAGLRSKVVFCSPATLFAVLAVIRQAVDNFRLERTSDEILKVLGSFSAQWDKLVDKMDKLGRSLDTVQKDYRELTGTRRNGIQRQLDRIETLKSDRVELAAIELAAVEDPIDELDDPGDGRLALEA